MCSRIRTRDRVLHNSELIKRFREAFTRRRRWGTGRRRAINTNHSWYVCGSKLWTSWIDLWRGIVRFLWRQVRKFNELSTGARVSVEVLLSIVLNASLLHKERLTLISSFFSRNNIHFALSLRWKDQHIREPPPRTGATRLNPFAEERRKKRYPETGDEGSYPTDTQYHRLHKNA